MRGRRRVTRLIATQLAHLFAREALAATGRESARLGDASQAWLDIAGEQRDPLGLTPLCEGDIEELRVAS